MLPDNLFGDVGCQACLFRYFNKSPGANGLSLAPVPPDKYFYVGDGLVCEADNGMRLVNTFSDSLLSRDFEGRIVVTVEPFNWREIIKVLLDAGGIVKAVDEGENALRRFLPGAEPADGVYQLLLED